MVAHARRPVRGDVVEPTVVCIGALTLDLIASVDAPLGDDERVIARDAVLGFGGPASTAAVALARLGVTTAFVGTVGNDAAGELICRALERDGVDASGIRVVHGSSAMSPIWVDAMTGHRSIAAYYGTIGAPAVDKDVIRLCRAATWVHVDHVGYSAIAPLRRAGVTTQISVDAGNPIPKLSLESVSLYAPTEARLLERYPGHGFEPAIIAALGEGPSQVVVTRGEGGSVGGVRQNTAAGRPGPVIDVVTEESFPMDVVSTRGAGDVFHGALLAGLVRGLELRSALVLANATAALSCRGLDGRSAIPTWAESIAFTEIAGRPIASPAPPQ
jgi:sulfofructose kinase